MPILNEYPDKLPKEYWDRWAKKENEPKEGMSWIKPEELVSEAKRLKVKEEAQMEEIWKMLVEGANLEVSKEGRWP